MRFKAPGWCGNKGARIVRGQGARVMRNQVASERSERHEGLGCQNGVRSERLAEGGGSTLRVPFLPRRYKPDTLELMSGEKRHH